MIDADLVNLATVVAAELRAQMVPNKRLYRTGNMKRSVAVIAIDDKTVDVVIAVGPDGSITDSWVANEADPLLKNAALDVVRKFPKLIPTKTEGGRNVTATMRVPVTFCLN